ncbi:hypothetical protein JAAARDRAFT_131311 [Jaapia argillacea MUCL 33604]|uniref:Iron permease FTR1 n=1 Tax=Jaapia argillacea MUCL 33604 TaxID=933084 RepID=A0A067PT07_9AGAM|nr:hypothetical protein JAAARDRAFT_131311 [Jaapia argillacea MUCL 33604]
MPRNYFSVPIFFILFRETLEAAIIVSVLLALVEQIAKEDPAKLNLGAETISGSASTEDQTAANSVERVDRDKDEAGSSGTEAPELEDRDVTARRLMRKLRIQIFAGAGIGLLIAVAIGAAFIAIWFTRATNLWEASELIWEGTFQLIASLMIFAMSISMLKLDRAKSKWRVKLQRAFDGKKVDSRTRTSKWMLFILPLVTVLREGLEAVIFVGGVALGQPASSIPIAAIVGIICGLVVGFLIYSFASRTALRVFMIVMTNFLLLIGAGLFSKSVWAFQARAFAEMIGADSGDSPADGPGSFNVVGNAWHLDCCNPNSKTDGQGWMIFNAILGWTNSATIGSVLSYVLYWVAAILALVRLKFKEGRTTLFGHESVAGTRRRLIHEEKEALPQ